MKMDIEEMIADAKAEEEVKREQAAAKEEKAKSDFRETLREQLKEAFKPKDENKVTISLEEYVILRNKAIDLDRILNTIIGDLTLSYSKEYLRVDDKEKVADIIKVLYPEVYDHLLACELERAEREGE